MYLQWRNNEGGGPWPKYILISNTHSLSQGARVPLVSGIMGPHGAPNPLGPLASGQPGVPFQKITVGKTPQRGCDGAHVLTKHMFG